MQDDASLPEKLEYGTYLWEKYVFQLLLGFFLHLQNRCPDASDRLPCAFMFSQSNQH